MKYRIMVLALLMLCGLGVVQARDAEPQYRLRVPSADEYLKALPDILNSNPEANSGANDKWQIVNAATTELTLRFTHQQPSLLNLIHAFNALAKTYQYWQQRGVLGKEIVQSFITEKVLVFDSQEVTKAQYEDFDIEATPRDFDGDGQPEWTLYVQNSNFRQRYVVAYKDQQYQLIDVPLPWFGCCGAYYSTQSGFTEEQLFADLTGDGLPEWVLAFGGIGANDMSYGRLYVLQWQKGQILDISAIGSGEGKMNYESPAGGGAPLFPYGVQVTYDQPNTDGKRNIIIHHMENDNWGCNWQEQRTFSWQGKTFELINTQRNYDNVQGCEIRHGEESLWTFDFKAAIQHYERGLKLPTTQEYMNGSPKEVTRYATARLAIAYKLAGREEDAVKTINSLLPDDSDSPTLVTFVAAIKTNIQNDDLHLCQAAYDVFNFECPFDTDACLGSPLKAIIGRTLENSGSDAGSPRVSFPTAERAGCDLSAPVKIQLDATPLTTQDSPPSQLRKMGYSVSSMVHFDLNNDGLEEWVVWLDMPVEPLFFSRQKGEVNYQFSYVSIPYQLTHDYLYSRTNQKLNPYFDPDVQYKTMWLPDQSEKLLIVTQAHSYNGSTPSCPYVQTTNTNASQPQIGAFALWKLEAETLIFLQDFFACKNTQFEDVFGKDDERLPNEIKVWAYEKGHYDQVDPATYRWNEDLHQYKLVYIEHLPLPPKNYSEQPSDGMWDADVALQNGEFAKVLDITQTSLTNKDVDKAIQYRLIYTRALALEALKRPDETLTEYMTIYWDAPDSAWGKLAALHLECVSHCGSK